MMLRALWFAFKVGLIMAAAIWVAARPGTVEINWLDYNITAHVGFVLVGLLIFIFLLLFIYRLFLRLTGLPAYLRRRRAADHHRKGYRALTRGLSAVAAGDARLAAQCAGQTRKLWPDDKLLSVLLEAQAARLRGENDVAAHGFNRLMEDRDSAFLGLRGLMAGAMEDGQIERALGYARKALGLHPRQPWLLRTVYDLELHMHDWDAARQTLRIAQRHKAIDSEQAASDQLAMLMHEADHYDSAGQGKKAEKKLAEAHRLNPAFVPAAAALARHYIKQRKRRKAISVIETAFKRQPHPELVQEWAALAPENKLNDTGVRLRWFEKLVALRPDSDESQLAAAKAALEDGLWGEARQYLAMAEQIRETPRLCRLMARLAEKQGRPAEAAQWLEQAADAPPEEVWYCRETGRIYERWAPLALPQGSFNTIEWGLPKARPTLGNTPQLAERSAILLRGTQHL